jgi:hypothetical protein
MAGFITNNFGGGDDALHRAAAMPGIARSRALPMLRLSTGGCSSVGGHCVVNPATGNLLLQIAPPAGDWFYLSPVLSCNSTYASTSSEFGNGWSSLFSRSVILSRSFQLTLQSGARNVYYYNASSHQPARLRDDAQFHDQWQPQLGDRCHG